MFVLGMVSVAECSRVARSALDLLNARAAREVQARVLVHGGVDLRPTAGPVAPAERRHVRHVLAAVVERRSLAIHLP